MDFFPDISRLPDFITIETERETASFSGGSDIPFHDVCVRITVADSVNVSLSADTTPVLRLRLRLRWNAPVPAGTRFCGDAWERGYGDFEWRGFVAERIMPWYFYASCKDAFAGYGVRVRPDAMCFFCCDPAGVTLTVDVRCGGAGVVLKGKTIACAEAVCCGA